MSDRGGFHSWEFLLDGNFCKLQHLHINATTIISHPALQTVDLIGTIGERRLKEEFQRHNFNTALVCSDIARVVFEQKICRASEVRSTMGFTVGGFR